VYRGKKIRNEENSCTNTKYERSINSKRHRNTRGTQFTRSSKIHKWRTRTDKSRGKYVNINTKTDRNKSRFFRSKRTRKCKKSIRGSC